MMIDNNTLEALIISRIQGLMAKKPDEPVLLSDIIIHVIVPLIREIRDE